MTDEIPMKRCSRRDRCVHPLGCWQPATKEHFQPRKQHRDGFRGVCRACDNSDRTARRAANPAAYRERERAYYASHIDKKRSAALKSYYANREIRLQRAKEYYATNKETLRLRVRAYHRTNRETLREKTKEYQRANRAKMNVLHLRRRARKRNLPNWFTAEDWQHALDYFNGCCAVCGRPLRDLFGSHTAAADHWIPLADPRPDNPGTVPTNIVPLCHGEGGCNNRKKARDPLEFLETEFGKRRARVILKRIQAYFDSLK